MKARFIALKELIVIVVVLTVFAVIAVPNFLENDLPMPILRVRYDLRDIAGALKAYYRVHALYPPRLSALTTPAAYMASLPPDPYTVSKGSTYRYYSDGQGWIAGSPGPDKDEDLPWEGGIEKLYNSSLADPGEPLRGASGPHGAYTYDPTNGTKSAGDIWWAGTPEVPKKGS